jgi:hypothetical protein
MLGLEPDLRAAYKITDKQDERYAAVDAAKAKVKAALDDAKIRTPTPS